MQVDVAYYARDSDGRFADGTFGGSISRLSATVAVQPTSAATSSIAVMEFAVAARNPNAAIQPTEPTGGSECSGCPSGSGE